MDAGLIVGVGIAPVVNVKFNTYIVMCRNELIIIRGVVELGSFCQLNSFTIIIQAFMGAQLYSVAIPSVCTRDKVFVCPSAIIVVSVKAKSADLEM